MGDLSNLKLFLDEKVFLYNRPSFIDSDPIKVAHSFSRKEDIEISAFLTASIAWGWDQRYLLHVKIRYLNLDYSLI